jgi:hypothetical protein
MNRSSYKAAALMLGVYTGKLKKGEQEEKGMEIAPGFTS